MSQHNTSSESLIACYVIGNGRPMPSNVKALFSHIFGRHTVTGNGDYSLNSGFVRRFVFLSYTICPWPYSHSFSHGQWRGALVLSLICAWTKSWSNNRDAGDLRRHRVHYDATVMSTRCLVCWDELKSLYHVLLHNAYRHIKLSLPRA